MLDMHTPIGGRTNCKHGTQIYPNRYRCLKCEAEHVEAKAEEIQAIIDRGNRIDKWVQEQEEAYDAWEDFLTEPK